MNLFGACEKEPQMAICPKTFVHDCRLQLLRYGIVSALHSVRRDGVERKKKLDLNIAPMDLIISSAWKDI